MNLKIIPMAMLVACGAILAGCGEASSPTKQKASAPDFEDPAVLERWRAVKANMDEVDADAHALDLAQCLQARNPELRDRIAYEVLTHWLRKDRLAPGVVDDLKDMLLPWLARGGGSAGTDKTLARSFAALLLAELVRHDTFARRWSLEELDEILTKSIAMFRQERDYRGQDEELGWVHAIAHTSDLLWRVTRHGRVTVEQLQRILSALETQIARPGAPKFEYQEGDRLARVVVGIIVTEKVDQEELSEWLTKIANPAPLPDWAAASQRPEDSWRRANTKAFLQALQKYLKQGAGSPLLPLIEEKLATIP